MFKLFKKTSWKIEGKAFSFFRKVFLQLPDEFDFLINGLERGLYRRYLVNHVKGEGAYIISFDPEQSDKSMIKGKQFEIENIIIIQDGQKYPLNITVYEGLWTGFEIQKSILDFKNFYVDLSFFKKGKSTFVVNTKVEKLVSGLVCSQLDFSTLVEFDINGKLYYQIKELEDGNYIAIDDTGKVFGLMHDPYKIKLINKSIKQFVTDVNKGAFDFEKYLSGRNT